MKSMTCHMQQARVSNFAESILHDELEKSANEVLERKDWSNHEILQCHDAITKEALLVPRVGNAKKDSVKGEIEMSFVYGGSSKATDMITLHPTGSLNLTECKYAIKIGGSGPFRSPDAFCRDISDKFYWMERILMGDGEVLNALRVLVVNEEQFPFSVAHIYALMQNQYPTGSFSRDGKNYKYVLCSTNMVREVLFAVKQLEKNGDRHLCFTL